MNWNNLTKNKCPQCNKDWMDGLTTHDGLMTHDCGFKIRETKYREINSSIVRRRIDNDLARMEEKRLSWN